MTYIGGVRSRLIRESLLEMIRDALDQLGWLDDDNTLVSPEYPVVVADDSLDWEDEIALNTLSLSDEDVFLSEMELGSNLAEERWVFVLDFYAENKSVGLHMVNDLKTILDGRMPDVGRGEPNFMVKDYVNDGEDLFRVHIEEVEVDRNRGWSKPWQRNWYYVTFVVVDAYGSVDDA